jgi:hypothetical protein
VTITDRAGAVPIWTIGRDLLLGGLIARASCPAGMGQIRLWTCQSRSGPSLIIARMTSFAAFLELDLKEVADFVMGTLELVPQDEEFRQLNRSFVGFMVIVGLACTDNLTAAKL